MRSLQFKLGTGLFINLLFTFFVLWWVVSALLRSLTEEHVATHLDHDCEGILAALHINNAGQLSIDAKRIEPVYHRLYSGQYYQINTFRQAIYSPSLNNQPLLQKLPSTAQSEQRLHVTGPTGRSLLVVVKQYMKNRTLFTLTVAGELNSSLSMISTAQAHYLLVAALLLILSVSVQVGLLRSGFRPLNRTQKQLRELERDEREQLDTNVPTEVLGLVEEVNHLLRVLQRRLSHSRHALADLAHALKTPLTVMQQLAYQPQMSAEDLNLLRVQISNMHKLMARVLKPARLADSGHKDRLALHTEMNDLVAALRRLHQARGLSLLLQIPEECYVTIDREDVLELTGNLLDNACKWASSMVLLTVELQNNSLRLRIEDDGPGVCATDYQELATRGTRLDEAITGHGLGLSIARFICEQYRGRLNFCRSEQLGGFCAEATLMLSKSLHKS